MRKSRKAHPSGDRRPSDSASRRARPTHTARCCRRRASSWSSCAGRKRPTCRRGAGRRCGRSGPNRKVRTQWSRSRPPPRPCATTRRRGGCPSRRASCRRAPPADHRRSTRGSKSGSPEGAETGMQSPPVMKHRPNRSRTCRVDQPPRRRATAGIGAGRPSARTPSPGCSADARASSSVSVTPGPTGPTCLVGETNSRPTCLVGETNSGPTCLVDETNSASAAAAARARPSAATPPARLPRPSGRVRVRPISGIGSGTVVEVHTPLSYTVRRKSSTRPRDRWSASTFSSVAIHVQVITKPNLIMSPSSSRNRSLSRCALDRPLAPDFWNDEGGGLGG